MTKTRKKNPGSDGHRISRLTAGSKHPVPGGMLFSRRQWLRTAAPGLSATGVSLALGFGERATAQKKQKEPKPVTDTLIKVTTFTEMGATLRGAEVKLLPADKDGKPAKGKILRGSTNNMGEYPFHVPKTEANYVLRAEAKGFQVTEKVVNARGEDQLDIFLQLPAKKKK